MEGPKKVENTSEPGALDATMYKEIEGLPGVYNYVGW